MSEPRSLPPRPDLRRLREDAKRRRKAGEFSSIALAQLAVYRALARDLYPDRPVRCFLIVLDAAIRLEPGDAELDAALALLSAENEPIRA